VRNRVTRAPFGRLPDGGEVEVLALANARGLTLRAITYGATIVSLHAPDRAGRLDDVVLGHDALEGYLRSPAYLGALIGRYANRIARACFVLDGRTHRLAANDPPHHIHGGLRGFDKVRWTVEEVAGAGEGGLVFRYTSAAGEEGYPGRLEVAVAYTLTDGDELRIEYSAEASEATPVNLTQHAYFNLAGGGRGDVLGHELTIEADSFTPVDPEMIPTGEIVPVAGTPFDFREPAAIGSRIHQADTQLLHGRGYDHNYVLRGGGGGLVPAARLFDPGSGRRLDVHTTEPGMQFYSGNRLDGTIRGKGGQAYGPRAGLSLETQAFPDSPNQPAFPSAIVRPGRPYRSTTVFAFGVA